MAGKSVRLPQAALEGAAVSHVAPGSARPLRAVAASSGRDQDDEFVPREQQGTNDGRSDDAGTAGDDDAR